jgi:hypothetical protein
VLTTPRTTLIENDKTPEFVLQELFAETSIFHVTDDEIEQVEKQMIAESDYFREEAQKERFLEGNFNPF